MSTASTPNNTQAPAAATQIARQSLIAGDIIATRSDTVNSYGARVATISPVSHAILYTGGTKSIQWAVDAMPH